MQAHKGGVQQLRGHVPELVVPQVEPGEQREAGQAGGHRSQEVAVQNAEPQGPQPSCGERQLRASGGPSRLPTPRRQSRRLAPQPPGEPFQSPPRSWTRELGEACAGGSLHSQGSGGHARAAGEAGRPGCTGHVEEGGAASGPEALPTGPGEPGPRLTEGAGEALQLIGGQIELGQAAQASDLRGQGLQQVPREIEALQAGQGSQGWGQHSQAVVGDGEEGEGWEGPQSRGQL